MRLCRQARSPHTWRRPCSSIVLCPWLQYVPPVGCREFGDCDLKRVPFPTLVCSPSNFLIEEILTDVESPRRPWDIVVLTKAEPCTRTSTCASVATRSDSGHRHNVLYVNVCVCVSVCVSMCASFCVCGNYLGLRQHFPPWRVGFNQVIDVPESPVKSHRHESEAQVGLRSSKMFGKGYIHSSGAEINVGIQDETGGSEIRLYHSELDDY